MNIKFNDPNDSQTKILLNVIRSYNKPREEQEMIEFAKKQTIKQIENRYMQSEVNERYVFPRRQNSHHSSDEDEQSFEDNYILDNQNQNQVLRETYYIKRSIQFNNPHYSKQLSQGTLPHCYSLINQQQKKILNKSQTQSKNLVSHMKGHRSFGANSYEKNRPNNLISKSGDRSQTNQYNCNNIGKKESNLSIFELKKKLPESKATASSSRASNEKQLQFGKNSSTFTFKDLLENYRISQTLKTATPSKNASSPTSQIIKCDLYKHLQKKVKSDFCQEKVEQFFKTNLQKQNSSQRNSHLALKKEKRFQTKQSKSKDLIDSHQKIHSSGLSPKIKIPVSRSTSNKQIMKSLLENSQNQGYKHFIYPKVQQKQSVTHQPSDSMNQIKAIGKIRVSEAARSQSKKPAQNQSYETRDRFGTHEINCYSNKRKRRTEESENQKSEILIEKSQNKTLNELLKQIVRYSTQKIQDKSNKQFF